MNTAAMLNDAGGWTILWCSWSDQVKVMPTAVALGKYSGQVLWCASTTVGIVGKYHSGQVQWASTTRNCPAAPLLLCFALLYPSVLCSAHLLRPALPFCTLQSTLVLLYTSICRAQ